jgi:ribonuclease P protein component
MFSYGNKQMVCNESAGSYPLDAHAGQTFTKADRLLCRTEFIYLTKNGKRVQNKHFIGYFGKGLKNRCRIGITISKRVGNAPTRNRIKRLVREYFRLERQMFKGNWDIIVVAKKGAALLSNPALVSSLKNLFTNMVALSNA